MDFKNRLNCVREIMSEKNIGLMFLTFGANLFYLTGFPRRQPDLTDSNTYGDYVSGAFIGFDEIILIAARMRQGFFKEEADKRPWISEVRILDESERPRNVLNEVLNRFDLKNKEIAMDERSWMKGGLLFQEMLSNNQFLIASDILDPMRMVKDADEIELMKKISEMTDKVYSEVVSNLKIGVTEEEIANEVNYQFSKHGAEHPSFVTGVRFTKPNKPRMDGSLRSTGKILEAGDAITFDFGACYNGYCSDFGRSAFIESPPSEYQKMHDVVMEAQAAAIEKMIDGTITAMQLDRVARSIIEKAGYGSNFVHRLGHGIGVTVHEPPFLYVPDDTTLVSNMTFTVEPSIRLSNSYECRVEDVVMVTKKGGVPFNKYHKELTII